MTVRDLCFALLLAVPAMGVSQPAPTTDARLQASVSSSDIVLGQPNVLPTQAMPLGNGRLGIAIWAADGMTLQLNRSDTLPGRLSPGQVVFPGLAPMIADRKFHGRLSLFDGVWRAAGGGMKTQVVVDRDSDRVIVDVCGANPMLEQSVILQLWSPRSPAAIVHGRSVLLAEHWRDDQLPGASGWAFGSLAAVQVIGRTVAAHRIDRRQLEIRFKPMADGHYRVIIAAPAFSGAVDPWSAAERTLTSPVDLLASQHWWNAYWRRAGLISASAPDGSARYFASLRTLYLFYAAALSAGSTPGSQAGVADLFSSAKDLHFWDPAAYWEWNLRMQVAANLSAGLPELNEPFFALYRNNQDPIRRWTQAKMAGRAGLCVPETMRFNGVGIEYESTAMRPFAIVTHGCDLNWTAEANARTLTTGGEIGLWVWETYLKTGDRAFLRANYSLMSGAARFLLSYQHLGDDGRLHTYPSNAHETQHDVHDPTTDLSAIRALYPATIEAAQELSLDDDLVAELSAALAKTPELPLVAAKGVADITLPASAQTPGMVIAASYDPDVPFVNGENIGLEAVWPYSLIDASNSLFPVAQRSYAYRPFRYQASWSSDPIDAARLGFGAELSHSLYELTQLYQIYPNGMADLGIGDGEFYIEQIAIVADALAEALVQDYGAQLRIAPAIPPDWTMSGTVAVHGNARVTVKVQNGKLLQFELQANSAHQFTIANPWPDQPVIQTRLDSPDSRSTRVTKLISLDAEAGATYVFRPSGPTDAEDSAAIEDAAAGPRSLGRASIGLGEPCCAAPANYDGDKGVNWKPASDDRRSTRE
jgi:alpha-L-fucosidase 2